MNFIVVLSYCRENPIKMIENNSNDTFLQILIKKMSQTRKCDGCGENPCTHEFEDCGEWNTICSSCDEWPCSFAYEDCQQNDPHKICNSCSKCPCSHEFDDCNLMVEVTEGMTIGEIVSAAKDKAGDSWMKVIIEK